MAKVNGQLLGHPLQADSPVAPSSVPFDSPPRTPLPFITPEADLAGPMVPGPTDPARVVNVLSGQVPDELQLMEWFDRAHALPRSIDLGRILATVNVALTVHNAYRRQTITWNSFVNGAGAGTTLTGPTPPQILNPQESTENLVLVVGTDGVPVVDDQLDFGFTPVADAPLIPITFSRLVYFPLFPQDGIVETLGFLTDVLRSKNGTEKRASLRRVPRVTLKLKFRDEDGTGELGELHNSMLGRPGSTWGIPLWQESTVLTSAQSASDAIINVRDTAYRQFIADGVAVVFAPGLAPDIFQIDSFTSTTITPVNPMVGDFPAGTLVMPVKLGLATNQQRGSRWPVHLADLNVEFELIDVLEDLSDLTAWGTLNSKPLVDDCNAIGRGSVREAIAADITVLDNDVGPFEKFAFTANGRFQTPKQWAPQGIEKLWDVRALLYSLRGQQTSFYMPTDRDDLTAIADLNSGSDSLSITYAGYSYVFGNGYRDYIRVTISDGTVYDREVTAVTQNAEQTEEYLVVGTTWPATHALADIVRVEFLQNMRLASDTVSLRYEPGRAGARVNIPLTSVLGE